MATEVRQWQFWRAGFWKRPLLVVAVSLLPLLFAPFLLAQAGVAWEAGRALAAGDTCATTPGDHCLYDVAGTLDGPHNTRGPGSEWWVRPANGTVVDGAMEPSASSALEAYAGAQVTGVVHDQEQLVAVRLDDGRLVRAREVGLLGVLWFVVLGGTAASIGLMGIAFAWGSWRRTGSVVAVNGHGFDDSRVCLTLFAGSCIAFLPVLFGGLPLFFGAPAWVVLGAMGVGVLLILVGLVRGRRLRPVGVGR
jgi:hypothetical protein